jgi:hypothetical protein
VSTMRRWPKEGLRESDTLRSSFPRSPHEVMFRRSKGTSEGHLRGSAPLENPFGPFGSGNEEMPVSF